MSINMTPGKDWAKEDIALVTKSRMVHYSVPKEQLSTDYVTVEQSWWPTAHYVTDCGEYLSVVAYHCPDCDKVTNFKQRVSERSLHMERIRGNYYWYEDTDEVTHADMYELRLYPNCTAALVKHVTLQDGEIFYVTDFENIYDRTAWGKTLTDETTLDVLNNSNLIKVVYTDADIEACAKIISKKNMPKLRNACFLNNCYADIRHKRISEINSYTVTTLHKDTKAIIEKFYGITDGTVEPGKLSAYAKKNGSESINTMGDMFDFIVSSKPVNDALTTKTQKAETFVDKIKEIWDNPDDHKHEAIWTRIGDDIMLIAPLLQTHSWGCYGGNARKLFVYNVKTKTRFYGEYDSCGVWSFPIPSIKYTNAAINLTERSAGYYYSESGKPERTTIVRTTLYNVHDVHELFAGTNIAWILDNAPTYQVRNVEDYRRYNTGQSLVPLARYINNKRIGNIAINILATTGIKVLEQLLKAKLFNMYFAQLEAIAEGDTDSVFWDDDKKRAASSASSRKNAFLTYHSKASNLSKMFGININMLREIDARLAYQLDTTYSCAWYIRPSFSLTDAEQVLHTELNRLDMATFQKCVALSAGHHYYGSIWSSFVDIDFGTVSPKQIVDYIGRYLDCASDYRDYLRMRMQLKTIQESLGRTDIYSDKHFPIKPGTARRFIPFLRGMQDRRYSWRHEILTEDQFINNYSYNYKKAVERGDFTVVYDDIDRLSGIQIQMTPAENVKYLHDEVSYWVTFYQDSQKDELFIQAVKRVQDLEWSDPGAGLQIIAPTCVRDLKNEGTTLAHCVATYVDPIIGGTENIMFLRRTDMPDQPYYTVEVMDDGEIRQVHCYGNGDLTAAGQMAAYTASGMEVYNKTFDVVQFLKNWAKAMKGRIKSGSIMPYYRALCAKR